MHKWKWLLFTSCLMAITTFSNLHAFCQDLYIGPEFYWLQRSRENGAKQHGFIHGARAGYDRLKGDSFYYGIEGSYDVGRLHGKTATEEKLRSNYKDILGELRAGYTFKWYCKYPFYFTPYVGGGYGYETNHFISPSPLPVHFRLTYWYGSGGFLSLMEYSPCLYIGLNFKARYMFDGHNKITKAPEEEDNVDMLVGNAMHYRVELPLTYLLWNNWFAVSLVPFYEYREYGKHVNFPFDFAKTTLNMYGATFKLVAIF